MGGNAGHLHRSQRESLNAGHDHFSSPEIGCMDNQVAGLRYFWTVKCWWVYASASFSFEFTSHHSHSSSPILINLILNCFHHPFDTCTCIRAIIKSKPDCWKSLKVNVFCYAELLIQGIPKVFWHITKITLKKLN